MSMWRHSKNAPIWQTSWGRYKLLPKWFCVRKAINREITVPKWCCWIMIKLVRPEVLISWKDPTRRKPCTTRRSPAMKLVLHLFFKKTLPATCSRSLLALPKPRVGRRSRHQRIRGLVGKDNSNCWKWRLWIPLQFEHSSDQSWFSMILVQSIWAFVKCHLHQCLQIEKAAGGSMEVEEWASKCCARRSWCT